MRPGSKNLTRDQCLALERSNSVRKSAKVVTVAETNPAYLHCAVPYASDHLVAWTRLSDDALLTAGTQSFTTDVRFQISPKRNTKDWVLIIRRVQISDNGCYLCEINTEPITTLYPVFLDVKPEEQEKSKPAVVPKQSAQLMVKMEGDSLYLNCTVGMVDKELMPTIVIWTRNSEQLDLNDDIKYQSDFHVSENHITYTLKVRKASVDDDGLYACEGESVPRAAQMTMRWLLFFVLFFGTSWALEDVFSNGLAKICKPVEKPLDVLFILDGSGSVGGPTFNTQLEMLNKVIELVNVGENETQIGVLQYASYTFTEFSFKTYRTKEALRAGVKKIRHKSGTTKTGKALDKAHQLFNDVNMGSRKLNPDVARVAIIVSDGHSHDDPYPKAQKLREAGVKIIALGIGPHINMNELVQITDNPDFTFSDLTNAASLSKFTTSFKKLAIGEECHFARGEDGAEITCSSNSIKISISTANPFAGHLYIEGQFYDPKCNAKSNSTEVDLSVNLADCGIKRQFSVNPRGFLFESKAILQFHPNYVTPLDKKFNLRCFYQDKSHEEEENEIDWELLKDHAQLSTQKKKMPCSYKVAPIDSDNQECGVKDKMSIGDKVIHKWECSSDNFDTYQSMLIHSCFLMDVRGDVEKLLIDENGCSLDENIIETPDYGSPLSVSTKGIIVSHPDSPLIKIRCSLRFCDRLMGECDEILPPKCRKEFQKRQAGFPVSITPLGEPQILTFDHSKINKTRGFKRRLNVGQSVSFSVPTKTETKENPRIVIPVRHADVKLNTQPVRIISREETPAPKDNLPTDKPNTASTKPITPSTTTAPVVEYEEYSVEVDDVEVNETNESIKGPDDPFQEQRKLSKEEQAALEREILNISPELDDTLVSKMSTSEILLESQMISVQLRQPDQCPN